MPRSRPAPRRSCLEKIRAQLVAGLHSGRTKPGDRVPSVRQMAGLTEADPKTVHRAYAALAREGLLDRVPGSGTFVSEAGSGAARQVKDRELVSALNRVRAEAAGLGVEARVFARFVEWSLPGGLGASLLAVVECNLEQVALFSLELTKLLGIRCRHALLPDLAASPGATLAGCLGVVTTDFHGAEVVRLAEPAGIPVYRVALDPAFPRMLVAEARKGPVLMVVRDRSFVPGFLRFLSGSLVPEDVVRRFTIVEPQEARRAFKRAGERGAVYVSPLAEKAVEGLVPDGLRRLEVRHHLSLASVEELRARLAFDLAHRERAVRRFPRVVPGGRS